MVPEPQTEWVANLNLKAFWRTRTWKAKAGQGPKTTDFHAAEIDHEVSVLVTFCSLSVLKAGGFASWRQAPWVATRNESEYSTTPAPTAWAPFFRFISLCFLHFSRSIGYRIEKLRPALNQCNLAFSFFFDLYAPCMVYLPTFGWFVPQM